MPDTEKNKETTDSRKAPESVLEQHNIDSPDQLPKDQTPPTTGCNTIFHGSF